MLLTICTVTLILKCVQADILVFPIEGRFVDQEFRDMPSTFGNGLPYEGLRGVVVYAEPADACTPVKPVIPTNHNPTGRWILLVARRNCSFEQKVRMAQAALYDGVIVHNVNSETLQPMSADNSTGIHIPSVFVSESTGSVLRDVYANPQFFIIINSDVPFNINTHLLVPFAIVAGICFIVMVIFMIVKCIKDRRRQRRHRLPSAALNKIPTCKFQKGDPYETCAICLDDYVEGEKLRVLPCAHAYHAKCIDPWLTKSRRVCPVCKRRVFAHDETPYPDTDESDGDNADDTTPLVNAGNSAPTTQGGTFVHQSENPFRRAARSVSQQSSEATAYITASDHHSINLATEDNDAYDGADDEDDDDDDDLHSALSVSSSSTDCCPSPAAESHNTPIVATLPEVVVKRTTGGLLSRKYRDDSSSSDG